MGDKFDFWAASLMAACSALLIAYNPGLISALALHGPRRQWPQTWGGSRPSHTDNARAGHQEELPGACHPVSGDGYCIAALAPPLIDLWFAAGAAVAYVLARLIGFLAVAWSRVMKYGLLR